MASRASTTRAEGHVSQRGLFLHDNYDRYCYLPLNVFCGRHLLATKLRCSDADAAAKTVGEIVRIVGQIRTRWPRVRILPRDDGGVCREASMAWAEAKRRDYVFGLAHNARLATEIEADIMAA
jgi:hypothetical protein